MASEFSNMDRWSKRKVATFKKDAILKSSRALQPRDGKPRRLVAEGDSWFDYSPAGIDIIDCLRSHHNYRIKNFDAPYNATARAYLAGLRGKLSTRIGAAMRHALSDLMAQRTHRRLLLVISDGEPSDIDVKDKKYLVEDTRKVVRSVSRLGIDTFCVGLDAGGENYLSRIFGRKNVAVIDNLDRLPERLPMLYLRLTA